MFTLLVLGIVAKIPVLRECKHAYKYEYSVWKQD